MNNNLMNNFDPNLSLYTMSQAVSGDQAAIEEVVKAYEPYIAAQSTVKYINGNGETTERVDEDIVQSLRLTLIEAIPNFEAGL